MQPKCAGSPAPSVTWWKDGSVYDDSYELSPTLEATVANTMRFAQLSREDQGAKFTCQVLSPVTCHLMHIMHM